MVMARRKPLGLIAFLFLFPAAVLVDIISFILVLGNIISLLFIGACRLIFFVAGIKTRGLNAVSFASAVIEGIPLLSIIPGATFFVVAVYLGGLGHKKEKNEGSGAEVVKMDDYREDA